MTTARAIKYPNMVKLEQNPDYSVRPPLSSDFPVLLLNQPNLSAYSTYSVLSLNCAISYLYMLNGHATLSFVLQHIFLSSQAKRHTKPFQNGSLVMAHEEHTSRNLLTGQNAIHRVAPSFVLNAANQNLK